MAKRSAATQSPKRTIESWIAIRKEDIDPKKRTAKVSFSSEEPIRDVSWMPPMILLHTRGAFNSARFEDIGSVLFNHDISQIVGRPEDVKLDDEGHRATATIVFDTDPKSEEVFQKVLSGSLRGVSVRYRAEETQRIDEKQTWDVPGGSRSFKGPAIIVRKWTPLEISLTPIPADSTVGVGREVKEVDMPEWLKKQLIARGLVKEGDTDEVMQTAAERFFKEEAEAKSKAEADEKSKKDDTARKAAEAALAKRSAAETAQDGQRTQAGQSAEVETRVRAEEKNRVTLLTDLAKRSGAMDRLPEWLDRDYTLEKARGEMLDKMLERNSVIGRVEMGADARDKFRSAHLNALIRRSHAWLPEAERKDKSLPYDEKLCSDIPADLPLGETLRQCLLQSGHSQVRGMSIVQVADYAIGARALQHGSSDFPYLLENVANKALHNGFQGAGVTWRAWCQTMTVKDFKQQSRVKLSEAGDFVANGELVPIEETTVTDKKETYQIGTYAKRFGISRIAIINDDLDGLARVPALFGSAAARTINKAVYTLLNSNPTMGEDSVACFHTATHGNLAGTGAVLSVTTLNAGLFAMRRQKNIQGAEILNLQPRYLIAPATQEGLVLQLMSAIVPGTVSAVVPSYIRSLTPVIDPYLDDSSATAWYLAAASGDIDTLAVIFLNGVQTPTILRLDGTAVLGVEWVAYIDFGTKILEHRGLYKNPGA